MQLGRLRRLAWFAWRGRVAPAVAAAVTAAAVTLARPCAGANDTPSEAELNSARALFDQAEQDEDANRWQDALEKLRLVSHVKLTAGVRYHIALCETHLGALAGALEEYSTAQNQARIENATDVLQLVGNALADLSPRVPRLTLRVVPEYLDAAVRLDGSPLDRSRLGEPLPVDPGPHRIDATAPKRAPIHTSVTVHERESTVLEIPLVETPPSAAAVPAPILPAPAPRGPDRISKNAPAPRAAAIATTAAAVGLTGLGVAAFLVAGSDHARAVSECAGVVSFAPQACDDVRNPVRAWDWTAAASWTAAALSAAAAIVLWTRSSNARPPASLVVGPGSLGAVGSF